MQVLKINIRSFIWPLLMIVLIQILTYFPEWIENVYVNKYYLWSSAIERWIFSTAAFSVGDILYAITFIYALLVLLKCIYLIINKKIPIQHIVRVFLKGLKILLWVYILFMILWGFNYHRQGVSAVTKLTKAKYSSEELSNLTCFFLNKMNEIRPKLTENWSSSPTTAIGNIFETAAVLYQKQNNFYTLPKYEHSAIKQSLLTNLVSNAGYAGYLNPFTNEAQVNTDLPVFLIPYTATHEIAHQIGFASESEASFVGYLQCINSTNLLFQYSAYFEMYLTANRELMTVDFLAARANTHSYHPFVKKDIIAYRAYIMGKQNNVEPYMKLLYDQYLKANKQQSGINSYDEVISWIVAFHRTHQNW